MEFLKRHLFLIVCSLAGLGGVVIAMTGLNAMPKVVEELEKGKRLYGELDGLERNPVNSERVAIERRRIDATRQDRQAVFEAARKLYTYEPLVPEAFPNGNDNARRLFRKQYGTAMDQLLERLVAGAPATRIDIEAMSDKILDEQYRARDKGLDSGATPEAAALNGPPRTAAGVLTKAGAKENAEARAYIAAARKIYCYATPHGAAAAPNAIPSLDFHPGMADTGTVDAPLPEDVWMAQVGYWIQRDVIDAIVAVNNGAAEAAKDAGEERWVGIMPVKDVVSIRLSGDYVVSAEDEYVGALPAGYDAALPPGTSRTVYTRNVSDITYEVMQFTVKLVMDQRDIPMFVEHLTTNSFHTLLRAAYSAVPANRDMLGKIYGSEPTVLVVMDFETVMLGEVFRGLMPDAICERLADAGYGMSCPEPEKEESAED